MIMMTIMMMMMMTMMMTMMMMMMMMMMEMTSQYYERFRLALVIPSNQDCLQQGTHADFEGGGGGGHRS